MYIVDYILDIDSAVYDVSEVPARGIRGQGGQLSSKTYMC